ncbi:DUF421 domain-containing protein [Ramlibacter sp.]|uniref:DUF421 domain-containing protein n=1 Tax=Ramlibacter sp. TaxID=1917967 RepID=UPI002B56AA53|nr:YetF domain-containing protein [Ramlibacter sp.]HWI81220.1 YetF domain-containing protein [Ramlibacter sp.]
MPDLAEIFRLTVNPLELVVRGTAMYWFLFLLFRFVLRRDVGSIGIADALLLMLIADASQNGMAGSYESVTDACILVATLAGWNWLVDWMAFEYPAVSRLLVARPLPLVRNGRLLRRNMRHEFITVAELMAKLREQGIDALGEVKSATMENDGEISVVKRKDG